MYITGNRIIDEDVENILDEKLDWNYFSGKSILVTGANGMIPSYIVYTLLGLNEKLLLKNPLKVFALVRNKEKAEKKFFGLLNRSDFTLIVKDISNYVEDKNRYNIIIHAASQASPKFYGVDPVGTLKANTIGTMNLLEIAKKNQTEKFLFVSSGEVYGILDGSVKFIDESYTGNVDCTNVRSCYAESKRMGETMCVCYSHQFGIHTNMIRLSHTYGPGCSLDDGRVFADFVKNVVNGENIVLNSDGSAKRSFLYITDMIKALFYILIKAESGNAYNIASETETSILDLAKICSDISKHKSEVRFAKNVFSQGYLKSQSSSASYNVEKLKALGWKEKVTIKNGFERMILSYGN